MAKFAIRAIHVWRTVENLMCQRAGRRENDFAAGTVAPLTQKVASLDAVIPQREIKEVLLRHPGVLEVSVVGRPHRDYGPLHGVATCPPWRIIFIDTVA
jgi:hypothetical protein